MAGDYSRNLCSSEFPSCGWNPPKLGTRFCGRSGAGQVEGRGLAGWWGSAAPAPNVCFPQGTLQAGNVQPPKWPEGHRSCRAAGENGDPSSVEGSWARLHADPPMSGSNCPKTSGGRCLRPHGAGEETGRRHRGTSCTELSQPPFTSVPPLACRQSPRAC